jgi:hypothetical protein
MNNWERFKRWMGFSCPTHDDGVLVRQPDALLSLGLMGNLLVPFYRCDVCGKTYVTHNNALHPYTPFSREDSV